MSPGSTSPHAAASLLECPDLSLRNLTEERLQNGAMQRATARETQRKHDIGHVGRIRNRMEAPADR